MFTSSIKCPIRKFHKVSCTCRVVVLVIKPTEFLTFSLQSPTSLLELHNDRANLRGEVHQTRGGGGGAVGVGVTIFAPTNK